jgi:hypothetical protein
MTYTPSKTATSTVTGTPAVAQGSNARVIINGGGGTAANGSDGIRMTFNMPGACEQIRFTNRYFYYYMSETAGNVGVFLNIGGTSYSTCNSNMGITSSAFDTLAVTRLTGSAVQTSGSSSATGNGEVVMIYTKTIGGKRYELILFPNRFQPYFHYLD